MSNLESYAEGCISDAVYGMDTLDMDALREAVQDQVSSAVDSACVYHSQCMDIISRYDSEVDDSDVDDITGGREFKAGDWQQAMVSYASAVAYVWLSQRTSELLNEIDEAAAALANATVPAVIDSEPSITRDCPHGWAVHDREDANGVHYWSPGHLEGCAAVAVHVAGVWLSYTWTPESATP